MGKKNIQLGRLERLDDETKLTRDQAAEICGCAAGTIANHNYAGVLPYSPTRPITVRAGDLKVYAKMLANGHRADLHLGLRIKAEDCPTYSRLDGVTTLDYAAPSTVMKDVVRLTNDLFVRYRAEEKKKGR